MKIINTITLFLLLSYSCFTQNKTETYIEKYKDLAITEMNIYGIPASITLAQGILESGNGESRLALEGLNHFGIKCHDNWDGATIKEDDDKAQECFRKYNDVEESYRDHSLFLSKRDRYSFLFENNRKKGYKRWAKGLSKAGYATNPKYSNLLIELIEKFNLQQYDNPGASKQIYFSHSYGFPYLTGLGIYYFYNKSFVYSNIQASFLFSGANIGYLYQLFNKIYIGSYSGVIYLPQEGDGLIPQISAGFSFKKESQSIRYNLLLIDLGIQYPLLEIDYPIVPYLTLSYLF